MVSFQNLRDVEPAEFEQAADGYHSVSSAASEAKDRLAQQILAKTFPNTSGSAGDGLAGEAAAAAEKRLERLRKSFHYTQVECGLVSATLNGFAAELRSAKKKLTTAVAEAESAGFKVGENGSISWTPDGPLLLEQNVTARDSAIPYANPDPKRVKALGFAERIEDALNEAARADREWGPKLAKLKAQNDLTVSAEDWANVHGDQKAVQKVAGDYLSKDSIPHGESPEHNRQWWNGLSEQEKSDYVSLYPASVGALDGLPAEVRDEANRAVLAEKRGHYELQAKALPPEPWPKWVNGGVRIGMIQSDEWTKWYTEHGERKAHLEGSLEGMESIEERFDATGKNGLPDAYLLGFSPEGNGRAIVANGNPDTADHTAVYVPGTTANLGKVGGDIDRAVELWRDADRMASGDSVSTVTWLGYDAPQNIVTDSPFSHYANDGAPAFNTFMDGLDVTNTTEGGGHHTAIGHSYGTTLIGSAARQGDLNADDVVFAGSPGVQVGGADEMDVPKGHVWNEEADGDKVPDIGGWGHGGSQWELGGGVFLVPSSEVFGANQMETDTEGHSGYWDPGSLSLRNQAAVIVGRYGEVDYED